MKKVDFCQIPPHLLVLQIQQQLQQQHHQQQQQQQQRQQQQQQQQQASRLPHGREERVFISSTGT